MATSYLTHHLYPDNPHLFIFDIKQVVKLRGEPNTSFSMDYMGEHFWELIIYTSGLDSLGERIKPFWIDVIGPEADLQEIVNTKLAEICELIDWSKSPAVENDLVAGEDTLSPYVYFQYPSPGQMNVPIDSRIILRLREFLPAKGIDSSTVTLSVNGFSVTPDFYGNPYDLTVSYRPQVGV